MGDGHGAAGLDLLLKKRDDAAVAAQNITEAHRHEFRFGLPVHHLYHHLAQTLGRTHDVGGVDGLVGGYLHKPLDAVLRGGLRQLVGADDVVLDGLVGAFLHQRDVLMGRSVEHKLRPVSFHHMVQPDGVTDRADDDLQIQFRMGAAQLHLNIIGIIFVNIQNNKLLRLRMGDLTAQLAADAPAAAGDQHHLAGNIAHNFIQIDLDGFPAQQVLRIDLAQLADADLSVDHLENAGKHLYLAAGGGTDVQNFLPGLCGTVGNGEDDLADLVFFHSRGNVLTAAHNGNAAQLLVPLHRVVVNDAGQVILNMVAVGKFHSQRPSGVARADKHDVFHAVGMGDVADAPLRRPEQPVGEPDGHGADEAEQEAHHHAGTGHQIAVKVEYQHADHAQHHICTSNAEHLRRTDKGPDGVVQPENPEYQKRDHAP